MYSSRVCVEDRCVSTPARKGHVEPRALDAAQGLFSSSFLYVFKENLNARVLQTCPFRVYRGKRKCSSHRSPKPSRPASTVTNTDVYDWFPLIRIRSMNKSDELFGRERYVRAARPTKHTKFKTNKFKHVDNKQQPAQPEYGDEQADAGRDCRTCLARPNSQARTRTGKCSFSLFS